MPPGMAVGNTAGKERCKSADIRHKAAGRNTDRRRTAAVQSPRRGGVGKIHLNIDYDQDRRQGEHTPVGRRE